MSRDSIDSEGLLGAPIGGDVEMPRDGRGRGGAGGKIMADSVGFLSLC